LQVGETKDRERSEQKIFLLARIHELRNNAVIFSSWLGFGARDPVLPMDPPLDARNIRWKSRFPHEFDMAATFTKSLWPPVKLILRMPIKS